MAIYIDIQRQLLTAYAVHIAVYIGRAINKRIRRCESGGSTARAAPGGGDLERVFRRSVRCKQ